MKFLAIAPALVLSLAIIGQPFSIPIVAPGHAPARSISLDPLPGTHEGSRPSTSCSTTPCANGAPIQWYMTWPWGSPQAFTLPSRDDGEYFAASTSESCPGNITANPPNVPQGSGNVCFVGMQTFPIYFATNPASGNLLIGSYTMNIGSDDGSSLYLDSIKNFGPGPLETSTNYNPVVGSPTGCGYGCPSSWSSSNGNLVSAKDGGFAYMHMAYEECCGAPYGLSYWFYTNQTDTYGSGMLRQGGVGPGNVQTYFPQAVVYGSVTCACNGGTTSFSSVPVAIHANYGSGWTYHLYSDTGGKWGFDIPPSEFVGNVSDPYTVSVTPPQGYMVTSATVNGTSTSAPVQTSVGPGFAVAVNFQLAPILASVAISPPSAKLYPLASQNFVASTSCTNGVTCPAGISYTWSLTNGLGKLNTTSGSMVKFTAGSADGNVSLFVNASIYATTAMSSPAGISITGSTLTSVTISPPSVQMASGVKQVFNVTPVCTSACSSGTIYSWNVTNSTLVLINATSGPSVILTAGGTAGTVRLFVNATLNGVTQQSQPAVITLTGPIITLASVTVVPSSITVAPNGTQPFTATPTCSAACPSGITYSWTLTNSAMGVLSTSSGTSVTFTAHSTAGTVGLFVNATLNGVTKMNSALISIPASLPSLVSATVSPSTSTVVAGSAKNFTVIVTCNTTCPSSITYSWTLTNGVMGKLNSASTASVTFTAGVSTGTVGLFVNATLGGATKEGSALITIVGSSSSLLSVTVSPPALSLAPGGKQAFTATPKCGTTCPSGIAYLWAMSNPTKGKLNTSTGPSVTLTAGATAATLLLYVNATLQGVTRGSSAQITIAGTSNTILSSVIITPTKTNISSGTSQVFTPVPRCTSGGANTTCPSTGITYVWSLNSTDGNLTAATGYSATFTAGNSQGVVGLRLNATLNGVTEHSVSTIFITIAPSSSSQTNNTGLSGSAGYVLLVGIIAFFVALAVIYARKRRHRLDSPVSSGPE